MDPTFESSFEAIRLAVNIAQSDCVCRLHLCVCLLTETGERAGLQPFVYALPCLEVVALH